jgi:hypothetical protein
VTLAVTEALDPEGGDITFEWEPARTAPSSYDGGHGRSISVTGHETPGPSTVTFYVTATDEAGNDERVAVQFTVKSAQEQPTPNTSATDDSTPASDESEAPPERSSSDEGEAGGSDIDETWFERTFPYLNWDVWDALFTATQGESPAHQGR